MGPNRMTQRKRTSIIFVRANLKGRKKGQFDPKVAAWLKRLAGMSDEQIQKKLKVKRSC
jgi:hypothetical protein